MERIVDYLRDWKRAALRAISLGRRLNVRADILNKLASCADSAQGVGFVAIYRSLRDQGRKYSIDDVWDGLADLERKGLIESVLVAAKKGNLPDKKIFFLTTAGLVKMFEFDIRERAN